MYKSPAGMLNIVVECRLINQEVTAHNFIPVIYIFNYKIICLTVLPSKLLCVA